MKMILFNQNPMITKLLESVSKKLELSMEDFNRYQELSTRLKEDPEWILIADDECLEKLDQVDWLELKETISQNKNSVCMYKKGNEAQPFLEGFEMKIKKPFLPTEVLKVLQKKLGSNMSELKPSQNLDPTQEVLETNWDELENLGDLEALVQEEPNNEEQLLPTLNVQEEKEEVKEEEKEEVKEEEKEEVKEEEKEEVKEEEKEEVKEETKETPQEEEKPKDDEIQEGETQKNEEVSKELETQEELEIPKEETQEQVKEQEPIKEETQENKEEKQEKTQDSPSTQELEAMQELVKEIQENSNGQEDKKEKQENTEIPQELEKQELETPQEKETQENTETPQELEKQELEIPQEKETPQELEKQELEIPQEKETQKLETPQEEIQENTEKTQKLETQEDHYESIEDIPEPVMAQAMGEELPFLNESVAKTPNNENDTETPKESTIKTPQEKEESNKTSSPLELRLNLQDLLKSLNQESLKSLLENKTLSIKITLEDKKPDA
ncbi:chemotaxis regulatory protein ChePep [Helicobacter pylori]